MNNLGLYLKEIGQFGVLSAEEEKDLANRIVIGRGAAEELEKEEDPERRAVLQDLISDGQDAREALINHNLKLVVSIAKKYNNSHLTLEDLISEGNMGLVKAVDKFDPSLGWRFSTCATPWIKQAITKSIIDKGKTIRIPAHVYQLLSKYRKAIEELSSTGEAYTTEDIAKVMGVTVDKVEDLHNWKYDTLSLESPLGDESEDTLLDLQADTQVETPQQYLERTTREEYIQELIGKLKPRTQQIIKMRFGLGKENDPEDWGQEHTLEEIGDAVHLTRERVRQIINEALQELRTYWEEK